MTVSAQSEELTPAALPAVSGLRRVLAFDQLVDGSDAGTATCVTGVLPGRSPETSSPVTIQGTQGPLGRASTTTGSGPGRLGAQVTAAGRCASHDGLSVQSWMVRRLFPLTPEGVRRVADAGPSPLLRLTLMDRDDRGFLDISARDIELVASDSAE